MDHDKTAPEGLDDFLSAESQGASKDLHSEPKHYAEGGDVAAPEGLDQFIANSVPASLPWQTTQHALAPTSQPPGAPSQAPAGLDEFVAPVLQEEKYGTPSQQAITALEGAAEGFAGPLAPLAETKLGLATPEDIRKRAETNPIAHGLTKGASFIGSALLGTGEAALLGKAGAAAANAAKLGEATSLSSKIGASALKGATEMGLLQGGDELTKKIIQDPNASTQTALVDTGLAAVLGAAGGATFAAISPLWKATVGTKAGQLIEDFKSQMNTRINNPNPLEAVTEELGEHYKNLKEVADEVYGAQGLKARDIEKAMPELHAGMMEQAEELKTSLQNTIGKLGNDPHAALLEKEMALFTKKLETQSPSEIFNATQDLKKQLQEWGRYNKNIVPLSERPFRSAAQDLAHGFREALEDTSVWKNAAERQKAINGAFVNFKPALETFEKKFTAQVPNIEGGGFTRVIDPGKINTYMNQLGKPSAELKQKMLGDFLTASDKYIETLNRTHHNLGLESPFTPSPMAAVRSTLQEVTPGAKLANIFVDKGLSEAASKALSMGVGYKIGHATGIPYGGAIGAVMGEHALGPFLKTMLPAIVKPLLEGVSNSSGLKAASEFGAAFMKGEAILSKGAKNLFKATSEVIPTSLIPTAFERSRLDKFVAQSQVNPQMLQKIADNHLGTYLPGHGQALGQTTGNAVQYLNSINPDKPKQLPLDTDRKPSTVEKASYENALNIAQQPMMVVQKIKDGTVTAQDVAHLNSLYPALYNEMKTRISEEMTNHLSKGNSNTGSRIENSKYGIPYKTRIGLSLFLGQPLDSTMTPTNILAAQPSGGQPQAPAANAPQQGTKHSMAALNKLSLQYQTQGQHRMASKLAKD